MYICYSTTKRPALQAFEKYTYFFFSFFKNCIFLSFLLFIIIIIQYYLKHNIKENSDLTLTLKKITKYIYKQKLFEFKINFIEKLNP